MNPPKIIKLIPTTKGTPFSIRELLNIPSWPSIPITIKPKQGDPFNIHQMNNPDPAMLLLFTRGLFEHERILTILNQLGINQHLTHMNLVISHHAQLQAIRAYIQNTFTTYIPKCGFKNIINSRLNHTSNTRTTPTIKRIVWDNDSTSTVRQAKEIFTNWIKQGHKALHYQKKHPIRTFPAQDEEVILINPKTTPTTPKLKNLIQTFKQYKQLYQQPVTFTI